MTNQNSADQAPNDVQRASSGNLVSLPLPRQLRMVTASAFLIAATAGCSILDKSNESTPFTYSQNSYTARLFFINDNNAQSILGSGDRKGSEHRPVDRRILSACVDGEKEFIAPIVTALVAYVAPLIAGYIVDSADAVLQEQMKRYTDYFEVKQNIDFYRFAHGSRTPEFRYKCLRLTRTLEINGTAVTAMDFIARLDSLEGSALTIRPLRLYLKYPKAESADGTYGLAINITADAYWREDNIVKHENYLPTSTLFSTKITVGSDDEFYKLFEENLSDQRQLGFAPPLPLPPWSRDPQLGYESSLVSATMGVAMVGKSPWVLSHLSKLFSDNKSDIRSKISDAVLSVIQ